MLSKIHTLHELANKNHFHTEFENINTKIQFSISYFHISKLRVFLCVFWNKVFFKIVDSTCKYLKDDRRDSSVYASQTGNFSHLKKKLATQCTPEKTKTSSNTACQRFFYCPKDVWVLWLHTWLLIHDSLTFKSTKHNSNPPNTYTDTHIHTQYTYTYCHYLESKGKET